MDKICAGSFLFEFASLFATYMAFNEDEPDNTLRFLGIGEEMAARIYRDTLRFYLRDADEAAVEEIEKKIRALGYLRFLTILAIEMKDVNTPLKDLRIRNTAAHLRELARQIDSFEV